MTSLVDLPGGLALLRRASRRESPKPLMAQLCAVDQDQAGSGGGSGDEVTAIDG